MSAPRIAGWCPGAHRPMLSGDGLVVRVRPRLAELSAVQAKGVAELALRHGNGWLQLTNRANLQLRGVAEAALPALLAGLGDLGLLDADPAAEARRNIVVTPFWQDRDGPSVKVAQALAAALQDFGPALPGKFGFAVDAEPGLRHLSTTSADIRIEAGEMGLMVRADGAPAGRAVRGTAEAVGLALALAAWFVASGGMGADGRGRMRAHLRAGAVVPQDLAGTVAPAPAAAAFAPGPQAGGLGIGFAFGQIAAGALGWLAARRAAPLRLTPWRAVWLPGAEMDLLAGGHPDLITAPGDPLLRVTACTGAPGCPQARGETRELARRLAPLVPPGRHLHVSGCAKGCAHPGPADLAVVAEGGGYGLVRQGRAGDRPFAQAEAPALPALVAAGYGDAP